MSPLKAELFKVLETAPESAVEQTLEYLKSLLPPPNSSRRHRWVGSSGKFANGPSPKA
jgi:hypothetical protein